jgi:hypothetical protein
MSWKIIYNVLNKNIGFNLHGFMHQLKINLIKRENTEFGFKIFK